MKRRCDACGRSYEAKTKRSQYCDRADCRRRRARLRKNGRSNVVPFRGQAEEHAERDAGGSVAKATQRELEAANKLDTSIGQAAMTLARRLDAGDADTGSSLGAVAKELRTLMAEALKDMKIPHDPVDELRAKREKRLAGGGS